MRKHGKPRWRRTLSSTFALTLLIVTPAPAIESTHSFKEMIAPLELIPPGTHDSEMLEKVTLAVNNIKRLGLPKAQRAINEALQLDPRNAHLHFLNGFIYHLQARQGDTQKGSLALEGYQQALRIDPSHWIAQEFLGFAYLDLDRLAYAKRAFLEALLFRPNSIPSIYGLMTAAYLTGDAQTACAMANQFLKVSDAPPEWFLRSSIPIYASCGNFARAHWIRSALVEQFGNGPDLYAIDQRLSQWKFFYTRSSQQEITSSDSSLMLAEAFTLPSIPKPYQPPETVTPDRNLSTSTKTSSHLNNVKQSQNEANSGPRMLLVDVVLISTQELISTSKGVNLLNALTLQLGSFSGNLPAYSRIVSTDEADGGDTTTSTSITKAVTVPALSYSLNIANANDAVNEVLARPTLAAIEGLPSKFFSGTNLSAGVVSNSQEGGTTVVPVEKQFGIKLEVTPKFLPHNRVQLSVEAQRKALNSNTSNPNVAYEIEIGETTANANVVMNLGETLVLSGLSEKLSATSRDGVPGLQDIPIVQYFFSNERVDELQRSVLILITPRAPALLSKESKDNQAPIEQAMKGLQERFGFSYALPPNIEAALTQLQHNNYYREFRKGDVSMERWDRMRTTGDRLKEALSFLYY